MTIKFKIPPVISKGSLVITNEDPESKAPFKWELAVEDFAWEDFPISRRGRVNEKGQRTTQIGKAQFAGRFAEVVVAYDENDRLPMFSVTVRGDLKDAITYCSFSFEEVHA